MRIVEVEEESARGHWVFWTLGGAAVGISVGLLLSEKLSGRAGGSSTLWRRARSLVKMAGRQWMPAVGVLMELRDRWADRRADHDDAEFDELDEEYEETTGEFEIDDADEGADDLADGVIVDDPIGARVLEAFLNDPVLAARPIEIDGEPSGAVFLHGRVWAAREVAHAVTIAGGVPGVTSVRQRIRVRDRR